MYVSQAIGLTSQEVTNLKKSYFSFVASNVKGYVLKKCCNYFILAHPFCYKTVAGNHKEAKNEFENSFFQICLYLLLNHTSQNHRTLRVGRDLEGH